MHESIALSGSASKFSKTLYQWQLGLTALLLISIVLSKFLLSLSMIGLLMVGMVAAAHNSSGIRSFASSFFTRGNQSVQFGLPPPIAFWGLTIIFLLIALSGLYSTNVEFWQTRTRIALPFLALPLAFMNLRPYRTKDFVRLSILFVLLVIGASLLSYIQFTFFNTATDDPLSTGGSIPVPINHIRFSLFLCIAALLSVYFIFFSKTDVSLGSRRFFIASFLIAFFLIHLLAVRSAIGSLYLSLFTILLIWMYLHKKFLPGIIAMVLMLILPLAGYFAIPGFQQKVNYTLHQIPKIQAGELKNLSDGERLASIIAGMHATAEAPLFGHGYGDIGDITAKKYHELFPELTPKLPHNQWIFWSTGLGIIGALLCTLAMFCPLFFHPNYLDGLFLPFFVLITFSCIVESTFETAHGVALFVFFTGFFLRQQPPAPIQKLRETTE